jgi:hypothetical protein
LHYIGRLTPEKNIPMLLEALIQLDGVVLYIYGENNNQYGKYLDHLTKYFNIKDKVIFMGQIDTKSELYEKADFVILPSVHEGLPYCLLEARSFNIQIISHNISKINHHIPDGSYYQYDGININDFLDTLYIDDYNYLLKKIGYSEILISPTIMRAKREIYNILVPLCTKDGKPLFGKKILVPPSIFGTKVGTYFKNVNKIVEVVKKKLIS